MRASVPEMKINDDDGDGDGERYQHHGEKHVATDQRQRGRCRWDDVGNEEKEHDEGKEDGDGEGYFLLSV